MARPRKEADLKAQVLKRYEELLTERAQVDDELNGIKTYLKAVGAVKTKKRGRKRKPAQPTPSAPSANLQKAKPKARKSVKSRKKKTQTAKPKKPAGTEKPQPDLQSPCVSIQRVLSGAALLMRYKRYEGF